MVLNIFLAGFVPARTAWCCPGQSNPGRDSTPLARSGGYGTPPLKSSPSVSTVLRFVHPFWSDPLAWKRLPKPCVDAAHRPVPDQGPKFTGWQPYLPVRLPLFTSKLLPCQRASGTGGDASTATRPRHPAGCHRQPALARLFRGAGCHARRNQRGPARDRRPAARPHSHEPGPRTTQSIP